MEIILTVLMLLVICVVAFLFAAAVVIARAVNPSKQEPKPPRELDENEKRKAEKMRREVVNMLSYTGEPQEEIHID